MTRKTRLLALVGTVVLLLSGCTSPDDSVSAGESARAPAPVSTEPGATTVIAEQKDLPAVSVVGIYTPGDTVTVGIRSLAVDPNGKTMTLRVILTPTLGSEKAESEVSLYDLFVGSGSNFAPHLLDRTNLKRYDVIRSEGSQPMVSELRTGGKNGTSFEAWAVYAVPQDEVAGLEINVRENWPPFTDIPVTR